jgi:fumarylacetoacetase
VHRPNGQRKAATDDAPDFGPSRRLDYELELGVWIGPGNALGEPIPIGEAETQIAGLCLLNDWSARDIQAWEYQPLGPFLAKNFLTTISPWIVTAEALAPFRMPQPDRPAGDPKPLPYLWNEKDQALGSYAITLEASIITSAMRRDGHAPHLLSRGPMTNMYWTIAQMVAHHASNGCGLNPGDLLGTGTISAPSDDGYGSLLEISRGGQQPIMLPGGEIRTFLEDGDELILTGLAQTEGYVPVGFGSCSGIVVGARHP